MKAACFGIVAGLAGIVAAKEFPGGGTPTAFETRNLGDTGSGAVVVRPQSPPEKKTIKITYTAACPMRDWTNAAGQVIRATLIAYDREPDAPADAPLTLVREGKIRLWVEGGKTLTEYPLSKLGSADQAFVKGLVEGRGGAKPTAPAEVGGE